MSDQLETKLITPNKNRPTIGVIVELDDLWLSNHPLARD